MFFFSDGSVRAYKYTQDGAGFNVGYGVRIVAAVGAEGNDDWEGRFYSFDISEVVPTAAFFWTPDGKIHGIAFGVGVGAGMSVEDSEYDVMD